MMGREIQEQTGLSKQEWEMIIGVMQENPKVTSASVYGSRAKGNFRQGSDVDLALFGPDLHLNDVLELSIALDQLYLPYHFDLTIYSRIESPALKEHIDRVGFEIYNQEQVT